MRKESDDKTLDNQLAEFVDQMLDEEARTDLMVSKNPDLARLQKTVLRLQRAAGPAEPDACKVEQMRKDLISEWRISGMNQGAPSSSLTLWERLKKLLNPLGLSRRLQPAFSLALVAALVLLALVLFNPIPGQALPGASDGQGIVPFALLVCAGLGGLLFWSLHRRR